MKILLFILSLLSIVSSAMHVSTYRKCDVWGNDSHSAKKNMHVSIGILVVSLFIAVLLMEDARHVSSKVNYRRTMRQLSNLNLKYKLI